MRELDLIVTLTGGLGAALVLGYITHRLGLSPIVGYLLAGIAVGPHTPGFVADQRLADEMAEIGVILLMFGVGLQFHLSELLTVRRIAIPGAIVQIVVATLAGTTLGYWFGWDWQAGVIFGLAISVASTVVLTRVLTDHQQVKTPTGHIAVGWLVVEDIFTVVVLVLLPALVRANAPAEAVAIAVAWALANVAAFVTVTFLIGSRAIPWLLKHMAETHSAELFTLTVLVVALGIAVSAAKIFGVSMALGAFLAGMVVARSDLSFRAASEALPMRDAFAVLFFVSVGMLLDPWQLWEAPAVAAATLAIILLVKPLTALVIVLAFGYPLQTALAVSVALAQIGEFSFILAALGQKLEILTRDETNTLVAAAIVSISVNPFLFRLVDPASRWLDRASAARHSLREPSGHDDAPADEVRTQ
jgi:CPA2 family monovalent cation:H+ antiporter-2